MKRDVVPPQDPTIKLEEYKTLVAERRFVITTYMQAVWFYIAVLGLAGGQYFAEKTGAPQRTYVLVFLVIITFLAGVVAGKFKSMARHAFDRETLLASDLGVQAPCSIMWGYHSVLTLLVIVEASALFELFRRLYWHAQ